MVIRFVLAMCLLIASSACSVKFAYNNVDRLVRWQLSDYLDLNAEQKDYLQSQITTLMAWHRANHLPQYADYVTTLSTTFSDGVTEAQIAQMFNQFMLWGEEIEAQALPTAVQILSTLSDQQVKALPAKLEDSNAEIEKDELDEPLAKIQENWAKDFEDIMERFTGRLQRDQKAYLTLRSTAYQPERVLWAEYRRRWQADLMKLLEQRHTGEKFAAQFAALAGARERYYGEDFIRVSEENIKLSREVAAYLLSNLTEKQSARFTDALLELAEDFEELAAQGSAESSS
jgi:uncharacterized protein DUF6279